jgi:subtilisin family serine protease
MSKLARAITVALVTIGFAASAQAATYVVSAKNLSFDAQLARKVEAAGGTITARLPQIGVALVEADDAGFAARAAKIPAVRSAVRDLTLQYKVPEAVALTEADFANPPNSGEDDTRFDLQWGSAAIDVAGAWNQGHRGAGAIVAVLDSGIVCDHPDIAPNLLPDSTSFATGEGVCHTIPGTFNHGTHVAGIAAAADNAFGTIGVAPEAKILAVKVLSGVTGSGDFGWLIEGIVYAADHGADVINMSLGADIPVNGRGANEVAELVNAIKRAVKYARSQNATVIASAGNDARDLDHDSGLEICDADGCYIANLKAFPAEVPGVLAISATAPIGWALAPLATSYDNLASYSNYGQSVIAFAAPGGDAAYPGNENCLLAGLVRPCWVFDLVFAPGGYLDATTFLSFWAAGTSMAAPHVSGVAALIVGKHGGEMSPGEVEKILRKSAEDLGKPGNDDIFGTGRVNAARAVEL